jgi:hypothetical protein
MWLKRGERERGGGSGLILRSYLVIFHVAIQWTLGVATIFGVSYTFLVIFEI